MLSKLAQIEITSNHIIDLQNQSQTNQLSQINIAPGSIEYNQKVNTKQKRVVDSCIKVISIPRVNGRLLIKCDKYNNQEITIIAQYIQTNKENSESIFKTCDNYNIYVEHLSNIAYNDKYNEIRGLHIQNGLIRQTKHQSWGNKFSPNLWNKTVELMQQYPNIF